MSSVVSADGYQTGVALLPTTVRPEGGRARKWPSGVTIGKFNPPHLGHLHLIQRAASLVQQLFVVLCDRADQTIPAELRRSWLVDAAPSNVTVLVTPDDLPEASEPWVLPIDEQVGRSRRNCPPPMARATLRPLTGYLLRTTTLGRF